MRKDHIYDHLTTYKNIYLTLFNQSINQSQREHNQQKQSSSGVDESNKPTQRSKPPALQK
ncbi:hypothetical protein Hanom_Chr11g01047231 [Helianthus anomalus]